MTIEEDQNGARVEKQPLNIARMSNDQVSNYLQSSRTVLVPYGALEQHGPSLPFGTDYMLAIAIADEVSRLTGFACAPCVPFGLSAFHLKYPGTISMTTRTFSAIVHDTFSSLVRGGFRRFVIINAHFDNSGILRSVADEYAATTRDFAVALCDFWDMPSAREIALNNLAESGGHADAADASLMMHLHSDLVTHEKLTEEWPTTAAIVSPDLVDAHITKTGVIGSDQRRASKIFGSEYFSAIVKDVVSRSIEVNNIRSPQDRPSNHL